MDLNTIWFLLIAVLLTGYAILDGFDLGTGVLHLFTAKTDHERRVFLNSIGPVWDGNEVWLLAGGGAIFAAFPGAYATVFSGFYLALTLLLFALIFRAVSMEFRSKEESLAWRNLWDILFSLGSFIPALLFGVAVGNILRGLPIDASGEFTGTFFGLLNPYSLLVGILSLVMCTMQGAIYLTNKTEGALQQRLKKLVNPLWVAYIILYLVATIATVIVSPTLFEGILSNPLFFVFIILYLASVIYIPIAMKADAHFKAIIASSASIASMIGLAAISLYPNLVPSITNVKNTLTIYNVSSTPNTLTVMLIIALLGVPVVLVYTVYIYTIFKGKVTITEDSY